MMMNKIISLNALIVFYFNNILIIIIIIFINFNILLVNNKISFRKTVKMHIFLYHSYFQCEGIRTFDGTSSTYDIKYTDLCSVEISTANGQKCLKATSKNPVSFS